MNRKKEFAKFLSGFAAHEAIGHSVLSGTGLLPRTVLGITVTPAYNSVLIIAWWVILIALVYYAWVKVK